MDRLEARAHGSVEISTKAGTGFAGFIKAGRNGDLLPSFTAALKAKAADFLARYEGLLGVGGESVLTPVSSAVDERGATHITYEQVSRGVPVFGAQVKAHVDAAGNLTAVNGAAVPDIDLSVTPRLSPAEASAQAVAAVAADPLDEASSAPALTADSVALVVYRTGLIRGVAGTNQLAYQVKVGDAAGAREMVFVHAHIGKVLNRYPLRHDALHRVLYEQSTDNQIWEKGDALGRCEHELLQRRDDGRRRPPRVEPRVHRAHARADLPVAARRAQRGLRRHLGRGRRRAQRHADRLPEHGATRRRMHPAHPAGADPAHQRPAVDRR